ncbi:MULTISPECIES: carboxylesterase/lipase family protein [unclassified Pseudactinotalea]|uniref:carboxylesterase/lipase family protein n=1 Tax=unclassified Pseudactinotalea TaxID=2649176 RepID=UPI003C7BF12A
MSSVDPAPGPEPKERRRGGQVSDTDPVTTEAGSVAGRSGPDVLTFRGIPYAAAPEGAAGFAAPRPHPGWEGVRPALANGPTPTLGPTRANHTVPEVHVPGSERLNLNVFTPTTDAAAKLPVYVWIHGGAYVGGAPGGAWFDGTGFARRGIVTVTITYRLGFEGFGHVPGAPDNRGLLDQIAALEWVQRNIAAFGGDPGRVTIGGQSAGGGSVLALLASPATADLFGRAISHSAPLPDITADTAAEVGQQLARACGVEHTVAGWSAVTREQLVTAERALIGGGLWEGLRHLGRVLRERENVTWFGPVLGTEPLGSELMTDLAAAQRPLLLGATSHEFNHLATLVQTDLGPGLTSRLLRGLGMPAARARAYPAAFPDLTGTELIGQAITDRLFRYPVVRIGAARAETSAPTWAWDFRWRSPLTGLSSHCLDLPFAWHNLTADRVARAAGAEPPVGLADEMHGAIGDFIVDGDPGWAPFTATEPFARVFDTESWTGRDPYRFERIAVQVERGR